MCYFQLPQHRSISGWQAHTLTCLNLVFPFVCTPATLCTMSPRTFFFSSALLIKITMPPSSSSLLGLPSSCHLPCIAKLLRLHSPLFPRTSIFVSLDPLLFICFLKRNNFDSVPHFATRPSSRSNVCNINQDPLFFIRYAKCNYFDSFLIGLPPTAPPLD